MTRELEYLEAALEEAEAAARWYAERSLTASAAFSAEIDAAEFSIKCSKGTLPREELG